MLTLNYDPQMSLVARLLHFNTYQGVNGAGQPYIDFVDSATLTSFLAEGNISPVSSATNTLLFLSEQAALINGVGYFSGTRNQNDPILTLFDSSVPDFTIEFAISLSNIGTASAAAAIPFSLLTGTGTLQSGLLSGFVDETTGEFGFVSGYGPNAGNFTSVGKLTSGWHQIAYVRQGGLLQVYLDGVAQLATPYDLSSAVAAGGSYNGIIIGASALLPFGNYSAYSSSMLLQEFRVTNGLARYTVNYTPNTQPFLGWPIVPNLVGESVPDATTTLEENNGIIGAITQVQGSPVNTVLSQSMIPGAWVTGSMSPYAVNITVATGEVVPNLIGMTESEATAALAAQELLPGLVVWDYSDSTPSGIVFSQATPAGSYISPSSTVGFTLSLGPMPLYAPNLIGSQSAEAPSTVQGSGFQVGAVLNAPSSVWPAGTVMLQSPTPGTLLPPNAFISYTVSTGPSVTNTGIDILPTVITQYRNSPRIMQLATNLSQNFNVARDFQNWFNTVFNVRTAKGFGLDIWGRIVGVKRTFNGPAGGPYFGPGDNSNPQDKVGFNQAPLASPNSPIGTTYTLGDEAFRVLILCKAMTNIAGATMPALNAILKTLFADSGDAYVLTNNQMDITYVLNFAPTPVQSAILAQSGVLPIPTGRVVTIHINARTNLFGFDTGDGGYEPFEFGTFDTPVGA